MNDWAIAILPLLGVMLGAALQFWLSRAAEREKHTEGLRSQAYADYLRAVAAAAHLRSDEDLRDAHRDAADGRVGGGRCAPAPRRTGHAGFPHPALPWP